MSPHRGRETDRGSQTGQGDGQAQNDFARTSKKPLSDPDEKARSFNVCGKEPDRSRPQVHQSPIHETKPDRRDQPGKRSHFYLIGSPGVALKDHGSDDDFGEYDRGHGIHRLVSLPESPSKSVGQAVAGDLAQRKENAPQDDQGKGKQQNRGEYLPDFIDDLLPVEGKE